MKSKLSFQAFSDNNKTTNLSCVAFRAHDTRCQGRHSGNTSPSVFTTVLGEMEPKAQLTEPGAKSSLQFELFQRRVLLFYLVKLFFLRDFSLLIFFYLN